MARSFTLGDHFDKFVDTQLQTGRFNNASEVIRAGLRLLEEQAEERQLRVEEIRRSIEESRAGGKTIPADKVFDALEARMKGMAG
ncbi:type II toxin-antitoxin system ParD family antitoxin [Rhizobium puerariae]|uniref:Type II toxin-antitoxin system ParD family antitoxin n=1 Tax=Rhizobium puerariae TaxID=1585791 RepID=A0ABV6AEA5_9HYPH